MLHTQTYTHVYYRHVYRHPYKLTDCMLVTNELLTCSCVTEFEILSRVSTSAALHERRSAEHADICTCTLGVYTLQCCSVLQRVAVCCCESQCATVCRSEYMRVNYKCILTDVQTCALFESARPYESCKNFKGRLRRNAFSNLVHCQYKSSPPDRLLSGGNQEHNWVE